MWILAPVIWLSFAGYGFWIAKVKRRQPTEGVLFGLFLGPVGCVVEAILRDRTAEEVKDLRSQRLAEVQARLEEKNEAVAAAQAERTRRQRQAQARADVAKARWAEAYARFFDWFDRTILKFGWYRALPEVVQPMVIGLLISLPLVVVLIMMFKAWLR